MKYFKLSGGILIVFLMVSLLFLNGCNDPVDLQSKWLDKEIVIDADDNDWKDYPFLYDEKTRSLIGFYNDDKNLYVCFQTMDKDIQRQLISQGLYIWFNKTGGKEKELALCFPEGGGFGGLGGPGGPPDMSSGMPGSPPDMSGTQGGRSEDRNMPPKRPFPQGSTPDARLKILTSEDDEGYVCSLEKGARLGIEVRYTIDHRNRFIYELKMPFVETDKTAFVAEASASNQIGMGFMTAKMEKGGPPGGMGEGDMERDGRGGGGPGGGMGSKGESLKIWINVTLASSPVNN